MDFEWYHTPEVGNVIGRTSGSDYEPVKTRRRKEMMLRNEFIFGVRGYVHNQWISLEENILEKEREKEKKDEERGDPIVRLWVFLFSQRPWKHPPAFSWLE